MVGEVLHRFLQDGGGGGNRIGCASLRQGNGQVPGLPRHHDFQRARFLLGAESGAEHPIADPADRADGRDDREGQEAEPDFAVCSQDAPAPATKDASSIQASPVPRQGLRQEG